MAAHVLLPDGATGVAVCVCICQQAETLVLLLGSPRM